jgi:DNA-3-methyladenine glycosylase I
MSTEKKRCRWAMGDPLMTEYHDLEWGKPQHDDTRFFEFLTLEGAQAGLSWRTILRKRSGYRDAFADFDVAAVARYTPRQIERVLRDANVVRNRLKVESTVTNAREFLKVQREFGSFDAWIWSFVDGRPSARRWKSQSDVPAVTPEAEAMSIALRKRGFRFVGPTICYAFMQACGLVNDHIAACFRAPKPRARAIRTRPRHPGSGS